MASDNQRSDGFKLPGSSLDEVYKVIQGYANVGKAASLSDISKQTGMHTTVISRNVGFLLSLGLLEGGKSKAATELGARLGLALMHDVADEIEKVLDRVVAENEFLKSVLAAVRIRKGMDESALRSHIAFSAGQSKTGSTATGANAVVELLKQSGHLQEVDGKLAIAAPDISQIPDAKEDASPEEEKSPTFAQISSGNLKVFQNRSPFPISMEIKVDCAPEDLDTLGEKLRKVIADFAKESGDGENEA